MPYSRKRKRFSRRRTRRSFRSRKALARTYLRKWVRKRRARRRASVHTLARRVRTLSKRMITAKKHYYTVAENVLVENNINFIKLGSNGAYDGSLTNLPYRNSINPNTGLAFPDYQAREPDSIKGCISSISGRLSVHCSGPTEATTTEHYWIALVAVKVGTGTGSITVPQPSQVWDPSDTFIPGGTSLLPIWRMFMPNSEFPEIGGKLFKVVRVWTGSLQPQQGPHALETDYGGLAQENNAVGTDNPFVPAPPATDAFTYTVPGGNSFGYASTIPSFKSMHFTHVMNNKIVDFDAPNDRESQNVKYYLLACGNNPLGSRQGYRVNATIRTTFYDT